MSEFSRKNPIYRLRAYLHSLLKVPPPLVTIRFLERDWTIHDGAIRQTPDYDDAWLAACAAHAKTVLDIGANKGQAAMIILLNDNVEKIVLVDPNPSALAVAASNLIHSNVSHKAAFIRAFVSERDDENVRFWTVGLGAAGSIYASHAKSAASKEESFSVKTITIDKICEYHQLKPDLIKIDVEGAEMKVLQGSKRCTAELQPRYLVEMHSNKDLTMRDNATQVIQWCRENAYTPYYLKDHAILESPEKIAHRGRCHLMLQPSTWAYPDWLRSVNQSDSLSTIFKRS
jgi:FkbM family methyltransferase